MAWGVDRLRHGIEIDFYYDELVADIPFEHPAKLLDVRENRLYLEGNRRLDIEATTFRYDGDPETDWYDSESWFSDIILDRELANTKTNDSAGIVELQTTSDRRTLIYVRKRPVKYVPDARAV